MFFLHITLPLVNRHHTGRMVMFHDLPMELMILVFEQADTYSDALSLVLTCSSLWNIRESLLRKRFTRLVAPAMGHRLINLGHYSRSTSQAQFLNRVAHRFRSLSVTPVTVPIGSIAAKFGCVGPFGGSRAKISERNRAYSKNMVSPPARSLAEF